MTDYATQVHAQGDALLELGRPEEALVMYQAACTLDPTNPLRRYNVGHTLQRLRRFQEAVASYDRALALQPEFAVARFMRATCLLQLGDLRAGFRELEWRKACPTYQDEPRYGLPRQWAGEDLAGKSLFIYPELYLGDMLQFGRFAVLAERAGARVRLAAPQALHAILRTMSQTLELAPEDASPDDYDFASALLSLPMAFGTTLETIPRGPYLQAESARVARWRERIGGEGLRVGVVWQGSANAAQRSFPLAAAEPLAQAPGVRLISLQKGGGLDQLAGLPAGMAVETLGDDFDPGPDLFLDTAAAATCCDLVVSADTSVAHLAGALGAPTWVALGWLSDWRWLDARADSPWYPSARLFRQPTPGDWRGVFAAMAEALRR